MTAKVVTVAQMQALEDASEQAGISKDALMENAGQACAEYVRGYLGGCAGRRATILIGPGNNGADGLVIARHLRRWGAEVVCYVVCGRPSVDPKMADALAYDVTVVDAAADHDYQLLDALLSRSHLVVDAILGAGRYRPLDGAVAEVAVMVNRHRRERPSFAVIAIDLPTGVNPDTGAADAASISAEITLALYFPKYGIASFPGAGYAGRIIILDIGLPRRALADANLPTQWMTRSAAVDLLPARPLNSHKGLFGHLLIVAGSRNFVGAATLAAMGAHRAGAGLVTLATPQSVYPIAAAKLTETIHLPLPEDAAGRVDAVGADIIKERIAGYSALAIGCGLGLSTGTTEFIERLLLSPSHHSREGGNPLPPTIVDADGLNNLSRCQNWPSRLSCPAVLTPHPGEMTTLTGQATPDIQADRLAAAARSAAQWEQTVLLKGAHSVAASPDGRQCILPFANPALAAGGTGDVLTGIIGALLGQGLSPYQAAMLGGFLHGTAAEKARSVQGNAGIVASDLLPHLPMLMNEMRLWPDARSAQ